MCLIQSQRQERQQCALSPLPERGVNLRQSPSGSGIKGMIFKGRSEWRYQKRNRCRGRHDHRQIASSVVERFWWRWWLHRHPPSNSWVTFVLLGVIGSWSCLLIRGRSDYSLSLFLSLCSVNQKCLQHNHYVR